MCEKKGIDHSRGLCGNVANTNITRGECEQNPPHCLCCDSPMMIEECSSMGMQQLGMFRVVCPNCPIAEAQAA